MGALPEYSSLRICEPVTTISSMASSCANAAGDVPSAITIPADIAVALNLLFSIIFLPPKKNHVFKLRLQCRNQSDTHKSGFVVKM
jgi:hypothetical protein